MPSFCYTYSCKGTRRNLTTKQKEVEHMKSKYTVALFKKDSFETVAILSAETAQAAKAAINTIRNNLPRGIETENNIMVCYGGRRADYKTTCKHFSV